MYELLLLTWNERNTWMGFQTFCSFKSKREIHCHNNVWVVCMSDKCLIIIAVSVRKKQIGNYAHEWMKNYQNGRIKHPRLLMKVTHWYPRIPASFLKSLKKVLRVSTKPPTTDDHSRHRIIISHKPKITLKMHVTF